MLHKKKDEQSPEAILSEEIGITDREVHKLKRHELLQLLVEQGDEDTKLQRRIERRTKQINQVREENRRLKDKLNGKDEQIESLKEKLNAKDEQIESLKGKLNGKDEQIEVLAERLNEKDGKIETLKTRLNEKDARIARMKKELETQSFGEAAAGEAGIPSGEIFQRLESIFEVTLYTAGRYLGHIRNRQGKRAKDATGLEPKQDATGAEPRQDATGSEPRQDATGTEPKQDTTGSEPRQDATGSEPRQDATGSEPDAGGDAKEHLKPTRRQEQDFADDTDLRSPAEEVLSGTGAYNNKEEKGSEAPENADIGAAKGGTPAGETETQDSPGAKEIGNHPHHRDGGGGADRAAGVPDVPSGRDIHGGNP